MIIEGRTEWETPELIVLARSRPEEAVLKACKGVGLVGTGDPQAKNGECHNATACKFCNAITAS